MADPSALDSDVTSILMVRHTDVHNPENIVYGRLPRFRLSSLGAKQALETANFLAPLHVRDLYASPRLRARQTAKLLLSALELERIHTSRLIDEVLTGHQGRSNSILDGKFNFYDSLVDPHDETIADVATRMRRFLELVRKRHSGQIVAAVSHADPIMILRASVLGLPLHIDNLRGRYYPSKGSVMQFSFLSESSHPVVIYHAPVDDPSNSGAVSAKQSDSGRSGP